MLRAQRTSFNTLDNWGHKIPTQSKERKDDRKEKVKGPWPWTHTIHSVRYISQVARFRFMQVGKSSKLLLGQRKKKHELICVFDVKIHIFIMDEMTS